MRGVTRSSERVGMGALSVGTSSNVDVKEGGACVSPRQTESHKLKMSKVKVGRVCGYEYACGHMHARVKEDGMGALSVKLKTSA
jgi:hypothetical protein